MQVNKTSLKGNCNSRSMNNKANSMIYVFCLSDRSFGFYYFSHKNHLMYVYVEKLEAYTDKSCVAVLLQWMVSAIQYGVVQGIYLGKRSVCIALAPMCSHTQWRGSKQGDFFSPKKEGRGEISALSRVCAVCTLLAATKGGRAFTIAEVNIKWLQ